MTTTTTGGATACLRRFLFHGKADGASDGQLLECFLTRGEDGAFAALVRRHGPMVLGVCRRVLRHAQDAEDAFQATFLVLVRRAASVAPREAVGPWLYGVAYRTALKARTAAARRRHRERKAGEARLDRPTAGDAAELRPTLDEELSRLPECYRAALVLCDLEGKSRRDAAVCLCVAEGTLSSRLARARRILAQRLARRGITPAVMGATAPPVPLLIHTTVQAATRFAAGNAAAAGAACARAAALAEGVHRAMALTKWKVASLFLAITAVIGVTVGTITSPAFAGKPADKPGDKAAAAAADKPDKPPVGPTVSVVIKSVDADKHTLTAGTSEKGEKGEKTFDLAKDVKVFLTDDLVKGQQKDGALADVAPDSPATLQLSLDGKTVVAITLHPRTLYGGVKSVDLAKNAVTVAMKGKDGPVEKTLTLLKAAKIIVSDGLTKTETPEEGKLADLTEGTPVIVAESVAEKDGATQIRVQGHTVFGAVKGVDAGTKTVTITTKEDGTLVDKSYILVKDARIEVTSNTGTQAGTLADVREGDSIVLTLSVVDKEKAAFVRVNKGK
jgi:RNA polymerase sigma factor (sigma-70 family)